MSYKYHYKNANIGFAVNHIAIDGNFIDGYETFPSLEVDFKNSLELIDFEYGGSAGKGNDVDYSYEYFFNVNIKPFDNSDESFVIGYKNRTLNLENGNDEYKIEFSGPFVGVNTKF